MDIDLFKIPNNLDRILRDHKGPVVTRFPPENSGYLHIGHVKAIFINYVIAKKYNGKMVLRFDNTNPVTESQEFEDKIKEDIATLQVVPDATTYSSDYFDLLIKFAEDLIINHKAYVDITPKELMKEQRWQNIESKYRNNSVEQNMELWQKMKEGLLISSTLRIKIDMKHSNANCRDPTIFRYIDKPHHRTGDKFKVYPTYDFTCPIIDSFEGITHAFRSVEYQDREEQYNFILDTLNLRKPQVFCYGKVKIENVILSKRKIKALIEKGVISSWEDPRLFTLRGLLNRGFHLLALKQFVATLGFSAKTPPIMSPIKLHAINRKIVDKIATRYTCVPKDNYKEFKINGLNNEANTKEIQRWTRNPELGKRVLEYSDTILISNDEFNAFFPNEEITLMNWGNVFVNVIVNDLELTLHLDGDFRLTSKKVPWVSKNSVEVRIDKYTGYDPCVSTFYIGEGQLLNIKKGDYVQFIKMNYYMCTDIDKVNRKVSFIELD